MECANASAIGSVGCSFCDVRRIDSWADNCNFYDLLGGNESTLDLMGGNNNHSNSKFISHLETFSMPETIF